MKRNLWPYAIIAYFTVFITGVVTWVVFAVHHEDQLVRPDYYEHEIRFQQHMDSVARTKALNAGVQIAYEPAGQTIKVALPGTDQKSDGTIQLYRPSDARLDRTIKLALDQHGTQTIDVAALSAGLWKVRLSWKAGETEYYIDQSVVLATK
jgi:hypothetical protein